MLEIELNAIDKKDQETLVTHPVTIAIEDISTISTIPAWGEKRHTKIKTRQGEEYVVNETYQQVRDKINHVRENPEQPSYVFKVGSFTHYIPVVKVTRYVIEDATKFVKLVVCDGWEVPTNMNYQELKKTIINIPI